MPELEQELRELGLALAFPETPDVSLRVRRQLEQAPRPVRRRRLGRGRALVLAFAVLLIGATGVLGASPDARDAVRRWFGLTLPGVVVQQVPALPKLPALPPVGQRLPLQLPARRADVAAAARAVQFRPLVPRSLGAPDEVYAEANVNGGTVVLLYHPRGDLPRSQQTRLGALITELEGYVTRDQVIGKMITPGAVVQQLEIDGRRAMWISGPPHMLIYDGRHHGTNFEERRLAGNVLLVEEPGGVLVRIEADVSRARAIRIARSLAAS